jgi:hypothetical protein
MDLSMSAHEISTGCDRFVLVKAATAKYEY